VPLTAGERATLTRLIQAVRRLDTQIVRLDLLLGEMFLLLIRSGVVDWDELITALTRLAERRADVLQTHDRIFDGLISDINRPG
jgi:hypothetical protein